ncbi:MAG: hypothetical protein K9M80_04510 [Candidatus Marinimicrobia bacterium]|nr:hypothetical protein [Candidatus Neomarinimicrobiota bacterium]
MTNRFFGKFILVNILIASFLFSAVRYNHPELDWETLETAHFSVHYHNGTENTARRAAKVAETVYEPITSFYNFTPPEKTHIIIKDTDDYANGGAYYYDNKILIWATPLNFILRGNHIWLRDVIAHEFAHIISLGKAMKFSYNVPGIYLQGMGYEKEKREDVVRGYPNVIVSYPLPGMVMPMWLAEGAAQYNYPDATNDLYDSHRDMILRDRVMNHNMLSLTEMGSFGRKGTGNESVYNQGWAFTRYLQENYGESVLPDLMDAMSKPLKWSINSALKEVTGKNGQQLYHEWKNQLENEYHARTNNIRANERIGEILFDKGTAQLYPISNQDKIFYLSNAGQDYLSLTSLFEYDKESKETKFLQFGVNSKLIFGPDETKLYYSRVGKPNAQGSEFSDIYYYDLKKEKEVEITHDARAMNPDLSANGKELIYIINENGSQNIVLRNLRTDGTDTLTNFNNFEQLFNVVWSPEGEKIAFDITTSHGRDIYLYNMQTEKIEPLLNQKYDERFPLYSGDGKWLYYVSDKTGIFNIYRKNLSSGEEQLLTNVTGAAFMPYLDKMGTLYYTLYDDAKFKIARIKNPKPIEQEHATYDQNYKNIPENIELVNSPVKDEKEYSSHYSRYFIMPRLMVDYGTLKPGLYFFSTEILERMEIFGSGAMNKNYEYDAAVMLEYHLWDPTIFLEFYNIRRNLNNQRENYSDAYPMRNDYTFFLTEAHLGVSRPLLEANEFRFDIVYSKYRTVNDQFIQKTADEWTAFDNFSYNYYKGINFKLDWKFDATLPEVNDFTNPTQGWEINTTLSRNYDKFLDDFGIYKDFGTLKEIYNKNYYWKVRQEGKWHHQIPFTNSLIGNLRWKLGWISKPDLDSFFNFFAGGMPGLRGYPYFSMEGRNLFSLHYTFRHPIFKQEDFKLGWFNLQNCFIGAFAETGNAWNGVRGYSGMDWGTFVSEPGAVTKGILDDFKSDVGVELRLSGFSFYAYPTSINLDLAYGLSEFQVSDKMKNVYHYDKEWRTYLTILFGL